MFSTTAPPQAAFRVRVSTHSSGLCIQWTTAVPAPAQEPRSKEIRKLENDWTVLIKKLPIYESNIGAYLVAVGLLH